ncbi:dolichol kinase isoform X1 [Frankliniella occidentalis]|uniref:dolichol kinase n=1 Tax=Frankliniella occidentalis TaxID=133901 RepID=A0A6J1TEZ5_FRAOC|nr:dolichol kinase isoform X1 [Frankliniella occidentalis]XP_026291839.1 dolichol kinase isoform X1 [Frankliniella occidentalis]
MTLAEKYVGLSKSLRISFKNCGYILRPGAGTGLWLIPLIPMALLVSTVKQILRNEATLSHVYFASTAVSCGLLVTTLIYLMRFMPSYGHRIGNFLFAIPAIGTLLFLLYTQSVYGNSYHDLKRENAWFRKSCGMTKSAHIFSGFVLSLLGGIMSTYGILAGLPTLLTLAPACFSIGEAVVVIHSLIIFLYSSAINVCHIAFSHVSLIADMDVSYEAATVILQVGMVFVLLMLAALVSLPILREPPQFFIVLSTAILGTVVSLHGLLGGSPILWILVNITRDQGTFNIILAWVLLTILAVVTIYLQVSHEKKATTAQRKVFHILAVVVFGSGILWTPDILYLASGVIFALFLVVEASRILNIPPLHEILKNGFILYGDEKDTLIALTPLYLLTGMAAPLWLTPLDDIPIAPSQLLPYMAGLLSIGVGDTAASFVGSNYGKWKWEGSNRTIEGTLACFLSQVFVVLLLVQYDVLPSDILSLVRTFAAVGITSLIEAKTDQVDNMVLPLVLYILTY